MSRIAIQAQNLIDVLKELGIPRKQFSVRTERIRCRSNGERWVEYGSAHAVLYSDEAKRAVIDNAQRLADQHLDITLMVHGDRIYPLLSSDWNAACTVKRYNYTEK